MTVQLIGYALSSAEHRYQRRFRVVLEAKRGSRERRKQDLDGIDLVSHCSRSMSALGQSRRFHDFRDRSALNAEPVSRAVKALVAEVPEIVVGHRSTVIASE